MEWIHWPLAQGRGWGRVVAQTCWYLGLLPSSMAPVMRMALAEASAGPMAPEGSKPSRPAWETLREVRLRGLWREGA